MSGRDRYRLFVITGVCEDGRVLLADGRLHKKSSPKKKNLRHLTVLAAGDDAAASLLKLDDDALYARIKKFESDIKS